MRTLTLANEAKLRGWSVCFVLRDPLDKYVQLILASGHKARLLDSKDAKTIDKLSGRSYDNWLCVTQEKDAYDTLNVIHYFKPDWVIADHYALDAKWHRIVKQYCAKILVIDDLADRPLDCKILLNQNLSATKIKYQKNITEPCEYLLGPEYALIRKEFPTWRKRSLERRIVGKVQSILITMGGIDCKNYTLEVLRKLENGKHSSLCNYIIVVGPSYPHILELTQFIKSSKLQTYILTNISNMAEIMAKSDLCIGAAGSTSWERCCLGLPTITLSVAENQKENLVGLEKKGAAIASSLEKICSDFDKLSNPNNINDLASMSERSAVICDGNGVERVLDVLEHILV